MSVYWRASSLNYSIQSRDFHCNGCPNVNFSAIMETILPKLVEEKIHSRWQEPRNLGEKTASFLQNIP